jgi:hypothetical protein
MPHPAEAIAMENPAAIATQFVGFEASPPCANAGTAKQKAEIAINTLLQVPIMLRIVFLL